MHNTFAWCALIPAHALAISYASSGLLRRKRYCSSRITVCPE